jgi:predicted glycogen debranching enzyme
VTTLLPGQSRSGEGAATTATDANGLAVFDLPHLSHSILDHPLISFGPDIAADVPSALRREWLVTNGLGGYASGTLAGVNTRRYHGLLVAALAPPVERMVLVAGSIDSATYDGHRFPLSTHEYGDGTVDPHGYRQIVSFALEGTLPVWTYAVGDALLEQRIWMAQGTTTTYVMYRLVRASRDLQLEISPLVTYRGFHSLSRGAGWQPGALEIDSGVEVRAFDGAVPYRIIAQGAQYSPSNAWYWNFLHRQETERGLDDRSDLFVPGIFSKRLAVGDALTLVLSTEAAPEMDAARALEDERKRQRALLSQADALQAEPVVQQLVLAADQFIAQRDSGKTVIAGYQWFNDWGRDTMISLPGLTLSTGRAEDAAGVLRTFAGYVDRGMLPNNFPDAAGVVPGYNTVDATLWYVLAIAAYERATGDLSLVNELLPVLRSIVEWHVRGTRYGIGVDPADGMLRAGEPGVQLTWMDAKIGDFVVTPRIGKPVEIQALWYNVLRSLAALLAARADASSQEYGGMADRVRASFGARFYREDLGYLADVVDGPDGDDVRLRPNQVFAASLPYPLVEGAQAASVVESVGRALLAPAGLRSLNPDDPDYRGDYIGGPGRRDSGYHQGPVWTWLLGPYAEAHYRVYGDRSAALALLEPVEHHLRDACLGSVSEILEGDPPHRPVGCVAQAWGVAETLRVWRALSGTGSPLS